MKSSTTLLILDGWGQREPAADNAIHLANTPTWDRLLEQHPWTTLISHGSAVGLPPEQMGNSEVGHLTLGAGRVIEQDLTRINRLLATPDALKKSKLPNFLSELKARDGRLHLIGLLSEGGVHAHQQHLNPLLDFINESSEINETYLHAILDGRDVSPQSAATSLALFERDDRCQLTSLVGRFYAMDRDQQWDRTQTAISLWLEGKSDLAETDAHRVLEACYQQELTDYFVPPVWLKPNVAPIAPEDSIIFFNYRADRSRQAVSALTRQALSDIKSPFVLSADQVLTFTQYDAEFETPVLFPEPSLSDTLGEVWSNAGLRQLRLAETEKYAHVTFFFNGGKEQVFDQEQRHLIPSLNVKSFDLAPSMQAPAITEFLVDALTHHHFDVAVCNIANGDLVGHTGSLDASIAAAQVVDACLAKLLTAIQATGSTLWITADHGNLEHMFDEHTQTPRTAHSTCPVPLVYVGPHEFSLQSGTLADVAPTLLADMGLPAPTVMTGKDLRC